MYNIFFGKLGTNWVDLFCNYIDLHVSESKGCHSVSQRDVTQVALLQELGLNAHQIIHLNIYFDKDDQS